MFGWTSGSRCTLLLLVALAGPASAQWDPPNGQWGKTDGNDLRVMTWNVHDVVAYETPKGAGFTAWEATARIVAGLQPDVLIIQEAGDSPSGGDTAGELTIAVDLWLHGGNDPFFGGAAVGAYVQLYAPAYDLPHVYVSTGSDGFNRNVILSRYPFADLNGDGKSQLSDTYILLPDLYNTGGTGGIRGFQHVEIDLPDGTYLGDVVVGNSHLKSGSFASDEADRIKAAQNIAYYVDAIYNGLGSGVPDPNGKVLDSPAATSVLGPNTAVILGGDWNQDEGGASKGPADWITKAAVANGTDGTDKDRTDMLFDDAKDPFTGSDNTFSSSKLDYLAWQDSVITLRRDVIFNSANVPSGAQPGPVAGFPVNPQLASGTASDHKPVICDFILPTVGAPPASIVINEVDSDQTGTDAAEFIELYGPLGATSLTNHFLVLYNGSNDSEYLTFDLDGQSIPADKYWVLGPSTLTVPNTDHAPPNFPATNAIQNGADAVALWHDPTGSVMAIDFIGTTVTSPPAGLILVDAVVYDTSDADDTGLLNALTPGQPQINENGNSASTTDAIARVPDGGFPLLTTTYVAQPPTPGTANSPVANAWTDLGCSLAGAGGAPLLVGTGTLLPGSTCSVDLSNAAPSAICGLFLSASEGSASFKGGTLKTIPLLVLFTLNTNGAGALPLPFSWPASGANPATVVVQYAISDAGAPVGVALSNALRGDAP